MSSTPSPKRGTRGRSLRGASGAAVSLLVHAAVLLTLGAALFRAPSPPEPQPITVALIKDPPLVDPLPQETAPAGAAAAPAPAASAARKPRPAPSAAPPLLPAAETPSKDEEGVAAEVGEAALAGAGNADSGPSPHGCELIRRVQNALRKDPLVQSEIASLRRSPGAAGGAVLVWDGDWVRAPSEDGKGLAAVREAISWEVAFAPPACLEEPVHGLVVLKLRDAGGPRLALGAGEWRWADLKFARGVRPSSP